MIELLIENKLDNKIYDVSEIACSISYSDSLNNGCSKLELTYIYDGVVFSNGSVIRFKYNDAYIFYGYVFSHERTQGDEITLTAYDQIRYLKAKDTFVIRDMRVDELIKVIANYFNLRIGKLDDTGYKLPISIKDNQTYMDMIYDGISNTLIGTGRKFAFKDNFGNLELTDIEKMRIPLIIGDMSLAYEYKYSASIDENTYNLIKISKDNESTGKRDIYIAQDSSSFERYGILQYYESADKDANEEQLKVKANTLLQLMNKETEQITIEALGDTRVRAGNSILANISDLEIMKYLIVRSSKHNFKSDTHTMSLELIL